MFCTHCGAEINDEAFICVKCGCKVNKKEPITQNHSENDDTIVVIVKMFLILGCISQGWLLIPLAWCIPITVKVFSCLNKRVPVSTGMKVCTLIFVNLIAGICLLCIDDSK